MLDHSDRGSKHLIAHSTSVVTLMRGLGRSFSHVVSYHVKSRAKGGANMAELNMMTKHMHAHVDMPSGGLVRGMQPHGNGSLVVHIDVGWARVTEAEVLKEHA